MRTLDENNQLKLNARAIANGMTAAIHAIERGETTQVIAGVFFNAVMKPMESIGMILMTAGIRGISRETPNEVTSTTQEGDCP